jgi:hypothetical protein
LEKRLRERARKEKQQEKEQRRLKRIEERKNPPAVAPPIDEIPTAPGSEPPAGDPAI